MGIQRNGGQALVGAHINVKGEGEEGCRLSVPEN